jgi:hypothetical protein
MRLRIFWIKLSLEDIKILKPIFQIFTAAQKGRPRGIQKVPLFKFVSKRYAKRTFCQKEKKNIPFIFNV